MTTRGVKSSIPTLGITRRNGLNNGSVIWNRIINRRLFGDGKIQERITLRIIARVSTSHRILMKLRKMTTTAYAPRILALL
jgi:hypothetical protein